MHERHASLCVLGVIFLHRPTTTVVLGYQGRRIYVTFVFSLPKASQTLFGLNNLDVDDLGPNRIESNRPQGAVRPLRIPPTSAKIRGNLPNS